MKEDRATPLGCIATPWGWGAGALAPSLPCVVLHATRHASTPVLARLVRSYQNQNAGLKSVEAVQCTVDFFFYCSQHCVLRPMSSVGSMDVKVLYPNATFGVFYTSSSGRPIGFWIAPSNYRWCSAAARPSDLLAGCLHTAADISPAMRHAYNQLRHIKNALRKLSSKEASSTMGGRHRALLLLLWECTLGACACALCFVQLRMWP
jgi:hypothetical protein